MWKYTQRSWVGGRLDAELAGRQDLAKYFQGASELKNFLVRRQGYIAKRAGTELVAGISRLLGHTGESANTIGGLRIIPVVHEKAAGYYLLMTGGRAFLAGREGIRLMNGTWGRAIEDYKLDDYAETDWDEDVDDTRPYYVAIPYSDGELDELDYRQSGDTIFLAHANHPPMKIVFDGVKFTLKAETIDFSQTKWARPAIKSCTGDGFAKSGATKTVYYVCTYVKDGVESLPSLPFAFTYHLPWSSTASVTLTFDKGDNESEPDYYNVYKKDSTAYGIISTLGKENAVTAHPTATVTAIEGTFSQFVNADVGEMLSYKTMIDTVQVGTGQRLYRFHAITTGTGGYSSVTADGGITYNFGESSNTAITKFVLGVDVTISTSPTFVTQSPTHDPKPYKWSTIFYRCGEGFRAVLRLRTETAITIPVGLVASCTSETANGKHYVNIVKTVGISAGTDYPTGANTISVATDGTPVAEYEAINHDNRRAVFDFIDEIKTLFGDTVADKCPFQVVSLAVTAHGTLENAKANAGFVTLYARHVRFTNGYGASEQATDDYITPDLSLNPPNFGNHFNGDGDYPSCVGIYQQRLCFAATRNDPFTLWMSCVGDLYNFNVHDTVREDDALSATLAATEFPQINHIVMSRDLMLFCDSGEWQVKPVSGNTLTYKTLSSNVQSAIGCAKSLKPIEVGDEIVFAKRTCDTLLATRYNYASDGYESNDLSVMSQWMFKNNPIVQMAYRQHPDSTIECVLRDGTIASLVYMKEHEVCAWSRHILGGGWMARGIATPKSLSGGSTDVMLVVERDGEYALWRIRDDVPIRDANPDASAHICLDGLRTLCEGETAEEGETTVAAGGATYAGYTFAAKMTTVRPEPQGSGETVQFEIKNAKDAEIRVLDSGDFTVRAEGVPESLAVPAGISVSVGVDGTVALATRDVRKVLAGRNGGDGRVTVESETPWPLNVLSLSVNYEIQPLAGSEG